MAWRPLRVQGGPAIEPIDAAARFGYRPRTAFLIFCEISSAGAAMALSGNTRNGMQRRRTVPARLTRLLAFEVLAAAPGGPRAMR